MKLIFLHRDEAELRITCDTTQGQHCKLAKKKIETNLKKKRIFF